MSAPEQTPATPRAAWTQRLPGWLALAAVLALLCLLPFEIRPYYREIAIFFFINLIMVTSYRLITTTGDWSFCHVVLMGAGAYGGALMAKLAGLPFWLVVPLAGVVAAAMGAIYIVPLLRTKGFGFFIASFALGELLRLVWMKVQDPFGGMRGLINIPSPAIGDFKLGPPIPFYFTCLIVMLVCLLVMYQLERSRLGKAWKSIHTDDVLAECIGINVGHYRSLAFVTGAFFAGIAGALMAYHLGAIDPRNFDLTSMVYLIIWVVVGGAATFWGPIIGLVVVTIAFEWTRPLLEWRPLLFGSILIFFLIFLPGGLESLLPKIGSAFRQPPGAHIARLRSWLTTFRARA